MIEGISVDAIDQIIKCKTGELNPDLVSRVLAGVPERIAKESCCQFGMDNQTTVLGFINGILPELTGKVLVKHVDDDKGEVVGWDIVDRWC